jgi:hypothetical protein
MVAARLGSDLDLLDLDGLHDLHTSILLALFIKQR